MKVIKNSVWLIIQPLALNIVSIAVIGYIARSLGRGDYGRFVFALSFITLFMPLSNMGLRGLTVRDIAKDREHVSEYLGRMTVLRFFLAVGAVLLSVIVINFMGYPQTTRYAVYIASLIILLQSVTSTFTDVFQAFEDMKYVAQVQLISGLALTLLSVAVIYAGYGLFGLMIVYCLGNLVGFVFSVVCLLKRFTVPRLTVDLAFWKTNLLRSIPFFFPALVVLIGNKMGIVILSKMTGDASVGIFGAANNLIEKLQIIPDGICTAIYPTLVIQYQKSRGEAEELYKKFFEYLLILGAPIAVGTTVLAKPIITLIYGNAYMQSVLVLQILVWWLFIGFFTQLQGWSVGAVHQEKKGMWVPIISTIAYIGLSLLLIPFLKEIGLAAAGVLSAIVSFCMLFVIIKHHLSSSSVKNGMLFKITVANAGMALIIVLIQEWSLFVSIVIGALCYFALIIALRIVHRTEVEMFMQMVRNKLEGVRAGNAEAKT